MAKVRKSAEVSVPSATLAAMAAVLTSEQGSVSIHTLVKTLSVNRSEELVAIQVALALRGFAQEATKETRYKIETHSDSTWYPNKVVYRLTYNNTAIFDGLVEYEQEVIYVDNSNLEARNMVSLGAKEIQTCSISSWENEYAKNLDPDYIKLVGTSVPPKQATPRKQDFGSKC
jgi:hypothetical protein